MAWRRLEILATVVVAALAMTSCASSGSSTVNSDKGNSSAAAGGAGTSGATSGSAIRVGVIADVTSPVSPYPDGLPAVKAHIAAINASGGINGRKIELSSCDTQGNPNQAANCARQAVANGDVAVLAYFTNIAASFYPILEAAKIPIIGDMCCGPQGSYANAYHFGGGAATDEVGSGLFLARDGGCKTVAVVSSDEASFAQAASWAAEGVRFGGAKLATGGVILAPTSTVDFSPYVTKATNAGAECYVPLVLQSSLVAFLTAVRQSAKPDALIAQSDNAFAGNESQYAPLGVHIVAPDQFYPVTDERLRPVFDEVDKYARGTKHTNFLLVGWTTAKILTLALQAIKGPVTTSSLAQALDTTESFDPGTIPPISFKHPIAVPGIKWTRFFGPIDFMVNIVEGGKVVNKQIGTIDVTNALPNLK
jgi:ABC-type branched-subunit amino acid transport system substrate-binding protein